jgi:SAM-dependent methyltransferase
VQAPVLRHIWIAPIFVALAAFEASAGIAIQEIQVNNLQKCAGVAARWNQSVIGEDYQTVTIKIDVDGKPVEEEILRTNRGFKSLQGRWSNYTDVLLDEHLAAKNILDIGTGDGAFVTELIQHLKDIGQPEGTIVGLDLFLSPAQKLDSHFVQGNAFAMPFADGTFDVVLSNQSAFKYFAKHDPQSEQLFNLALSEAYRVLRKGGILMFDVDYGVTVKVYKTLAADHRFKMIYPRDAFGTNSNFVLQAQ